MLAGWIWSSPIGCAERISRPCATASRNSCDGNRPVVRSLWRSASTASEAGNKWSAGGSVMRKSTQIDEPVLSERLGCGNIGTGVASALSPPIVWLEDPGEEGGMEIRDGFVDTVGNTPLIKLRRASEETGCTILGKAEFLNPGGSVKDRAALFIIKDAEERGLLKPGGVIVEGTAGNTGIGLALVGNARG